MKNKLHPLIQDFWVYGEVEKGQLALTTKTHFLEDISSAKTKYCALKNTPAVRKMHKVDNLCTFSSNGHVPPEEN